MNRAQRRQASRSGHVEMLDRRSFVQPQELTLEERKAYIMTRMMDNWGDTKHPYHQASGVIVDADPSLAYQIQQLKQVPAYQELLTTLLTSAEEWIRKNPNTLPSVPVNRTYYGFDPYKQQ